MYLIREKISDHDSFALKKHKRRKIMKKITSMLLLICMMFLCLTSCEKPEKVINEAVALTEELDSYHAEMKVEMVTKMATTESKVVMTIDMMVEGAKTDSPKIYAKATTEALGKTVVAESYTDGEYAYVSSEGMKYKMALKDTEGAYDYIGDVDDMLEDLPAEIFEEIELVKNDDGTKSVSINLSDEAFKEIFKSLFEEMSEAFVGDNNDLTVDMSDAKLDITVDKKYISEYNLAFKMGVEVVGQEVSNEIKTSLSFIDPGEKVTVTPMEGYESFKEIK